MGLQEVKQDILKEAQDKADKLVKDAEKEAEEIIKDAEKKAEKIRQKHQEKLEKEKQAYRKKEISNARMKAKEEKLKAKQEKMQEAFDQFKEELENLDDDEREAYVESCMDKVGFDVGKVIGGEEFEEFVSEDFEEKDVNGIIVVSDDSEKRQNFTFEKILQQYRENNRKEVAEKLF